MSDAQMAAFGVIVSAITALIYRLVSLLYKWRAKDADGQTTLREEYRTEWKEALARIDALEASELQVHREYRVACEERDGYKVQLGLLERIAENLRREMEMSQTLNQGLRGELAVSQSLNLRLETEVATLRTELESLRSHVECSDAASDRR